MLKHEKDGYVYLDSIKAKQILTVTPLTYTQIGRIVGKSESWLSQCFSKGRIAIEDIQRIKECIGVDLSNAVITRTAHIQQQGTSIINAIEHVAPEPETAKPDASYIIKIIEDYSYTRSNDIDRLIRALDRLTDMLSEVLGYDTKEKP